jgi:hypothetical protein
MMSEVPPSNNESEDVDDHYRRVSALDPSRPSESVRRAVLEHAARLAKERRANNAPTRIGSTRPARHPTWWRPAAFGTLAAAVLAGLLITPQFLTRPAPPMSVLAPAEVSQPKAAATPATPAPIKEQSPDTAADEQPPSPSSATVQGILKPRPSARNAAPTAGSAAEIAARNAPAKVASMAKTRREAAANSDTEADAQRMQTITATGSALPAPALASAPAQAAAPMVPAALAAELRRAAEIGDVPVLQSLLDKQPVINARDERGRTALMLATLHGQTAAVDALLARGADPNAADARGITPLQAAIAGNQAAIVAALQRAGAR